MTGRQTRRSALGTGQTAVRIGSGRICIPTSVKTARLHPRLRDAVGNGGPGANEKSNAQRVGSESRPRRAKQSYGGECKQGKRRNGHPNYDEHQFHT